MSRRRTVLGGLALVGPLLLLPLTPAAATSPCAPPPAQAPDGTDALAARRLQLTGVHLLAQGAGQVVAVIDTGVVAHERLGGRVRGAGDLVGGGDGRADCDGHGTAVAGLLAAAPGPDDDVVGMAPAATVLTIRHTSNVLTVPGPDGRARRAGTVASLAEAVHLAVERGATVVNISEAACLTPARAGRDGALLAEALRVAARRDVVVVAAAGNNGSGDCTGGAPAGEVSLPGWYDADVLTVAATGPDDGPAPFTVPGPWVDVAAPGTGLWSLAVGGGVTGDGVEGTSFAAPWVAGLAALVRERFPELTAAEVTDRILATAQRPAGGRNDAVGHGVVDPLAALTSEPDLLRPRAPAAPPAVLAGTQAAAPPPAAPPPVELLAAAALGAAAGGGVLTLRRGHRRR